MRRRSQNGFTLVEAAIVAVVIAVLLAVLIPIVREEHETLHMRWCYRQEMRYLFELTGFSVVAEHGDFLGGAPGYGTEQIWVVRADTRLTPRARSAPA